MIGHIALVLIVVIIIRLLERGKICFVIYKVESLKLHKTYISTKKSTLFILCVVTLFSIQRFLVDSSFRIKTHPFIPNPIENYY